MKPVIGVDRSRLHALWDQVLDSGHFADGRMTREFEHAVENRYNQHAAAFNSAGSALEALVAYHVHRGRRTWAVQGNTFYATAAAIERAGGVVYVIDSDPHTFAMSQKHLIDARAHHPIQAVVLTHVGGGLTPDLPLIANYCDKNHMVLLEDAAHCFGVGLHDGTKPGDLSDGAVFSFFPTKAVPIGDGGMAISRFKNSVDWCKHYRSYAKKEHVSPVEYDPRMLGSNFRISEFNAAIGMLQVARIDEILEKRNYDAACLREIVHPLLGNTDPTNWYKYIVPSDFPARRTTGAVYRAEDQIQNCLPIMRHGNDAFPGCELIAKNHKCLPIGEAFYAGMSQSDLRQWLGV
jgi:perosamine synthetase